jgi:hypothetical protein
VITARPQVQSASPGSWSKSLEEGNKSVGLTRDLRLPHDLAPRVYNSHAR